MKLLYTNCSFSKKCFMCVSACLNQRLRYLEFQLRVSEGSEWYENEVCLDLWDDPWQNEHSKIRLYLWLWFLHWLHHPDSLFEFDSSCHHNKHNGQCFFSTKFASERRFSKPLRGNGPKCVRGAACAVSKCVNVSVTGVGVLGRNMDSFTLRLIVLKLYFIK